MKPILKSAWIKICLLDFLSAWSETRRFPLEYAIGEDWNCVEHISSWSVVVVVVVVVVVMDENISTI
jgi:hypothetical protein